MTATTSVGAPPRTVPPVDGRPVELRRDIQGMRAVAVLLVLAWHAGVPIAPGGFIGVDVFFVISGFLITGLILREVEADGRLRLGRFYARRIRRLLPAAATVLVFVVVVTLLVLPVTRWRSIAADVVASALYVVNWRLADQSVDYLAAEDAQSPLQHYWSLAVEEQFYLVWPLLILVVLSVVRRFRLPLRGTLLCGLALLALPSLAWSWYATDRSPGEAYFVTTTRLWELALGAAVALLAPRLLTLPRALREVLAVAGLAGILVAAISYGADTAFPGLAALLPTLSAAALLVAGIARDGTLVGRVLGVDVLQEVGALSYSLYLWHWPVLVLGTAVYADGQSALWWGTGTLLVAASAGPAWLTYKLVENPVHRSPRLSRRPRTALVVLLVCTLLPLAGAAAVAGQAASGTASTSAPGAEVLGDDPAEDPDGLPPETIDVEAVGLVSAAADNADVYADGCHQDQKSGLLQSCAYGDLESDRVVALVGDSHAAQWQPALEVIAERRGWRLETYTKSACGFFDVPVLVGPPFQPYPSCTEWNNRLEERLTSGDFDLVITSSSNSYEISPDGGGGAGSVSEALTASYARRWRALVDSGTALVAIANTPSAQFNIPECLALNEDAAARCAFPRDEAFRRAGSEQTDAAERVEAVGLVDLNAFICPREQCSPVIGGVIVWRDSHHLTATYSRSLSDRLEQRLDELKVL